MGASSFFVIVEGKTAKQAFDRAVRDAQHEHGHGGYSGTIAEKHSFVQLPVPAGTTAGAHLERLQKLEAALASEYWSPEQMRFVSRTAAELKAAAATVTAADRRAMALLDDKWGPALCVADGKGRWIFCGLASS